MSEGKWEEKGRKNFVVWIILKSVVYLLVSKAQNIASILLVKITELILGMGEVLFHERAPEFYLQNLNGK